MSRRWGGLWRRWGGHWRERLRILRESSAWELGWVLQRRTEQLRRNYTLDGDKRKSVLHSTDRHGESAHGSWWMVLWRWLVSDSSEKCQSHHSHLCPGQCPHGWSKCWTPLRFLLNWADQPSSKAWPEASPAENPKGRQRLVSKVNIESVDNQLVTFVSGYCTNHWMFCSLFIDENTTRLRKYVLS